MSYVTLLDSSKTLGQLLNDKSDGLGVLGCVKGIVTEELNGIYTIEFSVSILEKHYDLLTIGGVVRAKPNDTADEQLFRIYDISRPMLGIVEVEGKHISYDLMGAAVMPFSAKGAANALRGLVSHQLGSYPFTVWTNLPSSDTTFYCDIPTSFRACLGGTDGSILDLYGGEFEWDNATVKLHAQRGSDTGITIEYGKNLIDSKQEENIESQYNAVLGYAIAHDTADKEKQICYVGDLQKAIQTDTPKTITVDFSNEFENNEIPTKAKLNALSIAYITKNRLNVPHVSISVKFVPLHQTENYKNIAPLEAVALGDYVTVYFERFDLSVKSRIVKTVYNVLTDRYESVQIGDIKSTLSKTIAGNNRAQSASLAKNTNTMEKAVKHASDLIKGGLGGNVVIGTNDAGEPNEILIMDTTDKSTAQKVLRLNVDGIGFSHNGYDGDYATAWTLDGAFVANFITSGELSADRIRGGTIDAENINVTNINGQNIKDKTINSDPLASGAAIERVIGDSAISNGKIGDYAVTAAKTSSGVQDTLTQVGTNTANISAHDSRFEQIKEFINTNCRREDPDQFLVLY